MHGNTPVPRPSNWRSTKLAMFCAGVAVILVFVACEHARQWRDSVTYDAQFIRDMSDPDKAHTELVRRLGDAAPKAQDMEAATAKSAGCITCHGPIDEKDGDQADMHAGRTLAIGCVDCHGGDPTVHSTLDQPGRPGSTADPIHDPAYLAAMQKAHVLPRNPQAWYGRHDLIDGRAPRLFGEHVEANPTELHGSANPPLTNALLNYESPEFVRFINPGDLRVADFSCGACHADQVAKVRHSMMTHGSQLWGAALYNNGSIPNKIPRYGESYSPFGIPQRMQGVITDAQWNTEQKKLDVKLRSPTPEELQKYGVVPMLDPLPVWNISQPGNILRIFERGNKLPVPGGPTLNANPAEIGLPNPLAEGGRPDKGLSPRGLGTLNRTDPVFIGLQKTRLLDPNLAFLGTNDHPGDFRSSGCTSCHTPYANDRSKFASGPLAVHGNMGLSASIDAAISKDESGHPVKHVFTNAIPSSQCITCHIHPGTSYANSYLGYMWWDNESDGEFMYPNESQRPDDTARFRAEMKNPEGAQLKGLWSNLNPHATSHKGQVAGENFLQRTGEPAKHDGGKSTLNDQLQHNQFADFHGHGWIFRAVHKKDRQGRLLDKEGQTIDPSDPDKWTKAVHLGDIHLEKGMHCVDCHFSQDAHGDGKLYGEVRNAIEVTCIDCHGAYDKRATLRTSGPAAPPKSKDNPLGGTDLSKKRIGPRKIKQFEIVGGKVIQRSALDPKIEWEIVQTADTVNPNSAWSVANPHSAELSRRAKTMRTDGSTWGTLPKDGGASGELAHSEKDMECYTCHTSWMTSCFGCHLPMEANKRMPMLHNENLYTRNWTQYNYQVLRDDVFMLGRDSTVKGGKIVPVRSSSAVIVSSQNANREWVYHQQQTISGEGYSGQAFNPHFPHATSAAGTTKMCTDCHVSRSGDNNAWSAQLFLQGTNFVNFFGRYVYVGEGEKGLEAVAVTEHDEPQAVYGSHLHQLAYPDEFKALPRDEHQVVELKEAYEHDAGWGNEILDLQLRGEYLYTARGAGGFYAYDVANIDNKGFSERIITSPVSPLGQRLGFDTKHAVAIASPSTVAVDPARLRVSTPGSAPASIMEPTQPGHVNAEQPVHPLYAYLYIGDAEEGLILTFAGTLLDGDPDNNFLARAKLTDGSTAFNPDGLLTGLTHLTLAGHYVYATCPRGLVIIDIDQPLAPKVVATLSGDFNQPQAVAVQFRYAFVTDADGLKVVDISQPEHPQLVPTSHVALSGARRLYVARTHAFVACGANGLAIIDVTTPAKPQLTQMFTADGQLNDCHDVKVGMTNASLFAYVADGKNGLRVLELMGPNTTPQFRGFAPPLQPRLLATYHTHGPALALSKGLDRDRAVDETGHQVAVFGRLGARPLSAAEMRKMYLRDVNGQPQLWTVTDDADTKPQPWPEAAPPAPAPAPGAAATEEKPKDDTTPKPAPRRPGAR